MTSAAPRIRSRAYRLCIILDERERARSRVRKHTLRAVRLGDAMIARPTAAGAISSKTKPCTNTALHRPSALAASSSTARTSGNRGHGPRSYRLQNAWPPAPSVRTKHLSVENASGRFLRPARRSSQVRPAPSRGRRRRRRRVRGCRCGGRARPPPRARRRGPAVRVVVDVADALAPKADARRRAEGLQLPPISHALVGTSREARSSRKDAVFNASGAGMGPWGNRMSTHMFPSATTSSSPRGSRARLRAWERGGGGRQGGGGRRRDRRARRAGEGCCCSPATGRGAEGRGLLVTRKGTHRRRIGRSRDGGGGGSRATRGRDAGGASRPGGRERASARGAEPRGGEASRRRGDGGALAARAIEAARRRGGRARVGPARARGAGRDAASDAAARSEKRRRCVAGASRDRGGR